MGKEALLCKRCLESYQELEELARLPAEHRLSDGVIGTAQTISHNQVTGAGCKSLLPLLFR